MLKIDEVSFGKIVINGLPYKDVLIVRDEIISRNKGVLRAIYGMSHLLSDEEVKKLGEGHPDVIIIGSGHTGMLEVKKSQVKKLKEKCSEFYLLPTPEAAEKYNELLGKKKINALFHTTC
jgi:hypothetical protein